MDVSKNSKLNIPALLDTEKQFPKKNYDLSGLTLRDLSNWEINISAESFFRCTLSCFPLHGEADWDGCVSFGKIIRNVSWIKSVFHSYLRRSDAIFHYLIFGVFHAIRSYQIEDRIMRTCVGIKWVTPRLLSRNLLAFLTRRNSFKHHPFLRVVMNYLLIWIKWEMCGLIRFTPANSRRWVEFWFNILTGGLEVPMRNIPCNQYLW